MGSKRMGLARTQALLESLKRDTNLGASQLRYKRKVLTIDDETAETSLTHDQSGTLIVLGGTAAQIQVINLPTITSSMIGTFYDFIVTVIGNSGAAGSYTINTGGHATDTTGGSATKGYDDYIGVLQVLDTSAAGYVNGDESNIVPASGEGTLVLADDTSNGVVAVGTHIRVTAVAASTIGTASGNTWLVSGTIMTAQATGFVTTAVFTAP
jgi:hypothetical protein